MIRLSPQQTLPLYAWQRCEGFSYIEVLVAVVLIGVCLVPIIGSLQTTVIGPAILEEGAVNRLAIQAKLDELLNEPYATLAATAGDIATPTAYSDSYTTTDNRLISRNVYISFYDGDNSDSDSDPYTGTDGTSPPDPTAPGLIVIQVAIDGSSYTLETLISQ